jgi:glycosyltransferase involved in cell wall biosynthesis
MPRLTIGLPVYNGAELLGRSLDRLLAQTFTDFVLDINDNASTDATADICADYARRDPRVRVHRNTTNVPWHRNFGTVLARADTPYFMWATHDDLWAPRFAEANIAELDAHPEAVCSVSKIIYFTLEGQRDVAPDTQPLHGIPAARIKTLLATMHNCGRLYGVYRTDILKRSFPGDVSIYGFDWLVVALTLLYGDHLEVPEVLLEREAQSYGHYVRRFGKTDRFAPDLLDWIVPLRGFDRELHRRIPAEVWSEIRGALYYLNLRQSALMLEGRLPMVGPLTRPVRTLVANMFHRRWRQAGS